MVDLKATNEKLVIRTRRIVSALTGLSEEQAERQLSLCAGELKTAVVAYQRHLSPDSARLLLDQVGGHLRRALEGTETTQRHSKSSLAQPVAHGDPAEPK
jgi:N-acetylmuramic acid 6-phosphate etherase